MATSTEKQQIQTLKYLVDATVSSARAGIAENLLESKDRLKIKAPQYLVALVYAETRIAAIEAEVGVLAERLRDLAQNVLPEKVDDVAGVTTVRFGDRRQRASYGFNGLQKEQERLVNALRDAIVDFVEKKMERGRCEGVLREWLDEARADGRIK
ncbi:hypothetical protein LTR36_010718 [Oleoguttula mirabilis]|uniref:Uncharacterized protein n=1 Tax=Oleoguttula mirabilis TaxID=1507867 RepID=A0AAV9JSI1_9PEZI|nr:hypothetical protein LTR36_010718 [Oleoguttula mirabilis]